MASYLFIMKTLEINAHMCYTLKVIWRNIRKYLPFLRVSIYVRAVYVRCVKCIEELNFTATITTCWVYLINDGITVNEHSVIVEWSGTGALNYLSDTFTYLCKVDSDDPQPCMLTFPWANEAGYNLCD